MEIACLLGKRIYEILDMVKTHLSGHVDSEFEATANDIKTEANKPMEHAFTERGTQDKWMNLDKCTFYLEKTF